jgi:hypothetical protein
MFSIFFVFIDLKIGYTAEALEYYSTLVTGTVYSFLYFKIHSTLLSPHGVI